MVRELSQPGRPLSMATRVEIRRLLAAGVGVLEVAARVGCSRKSVQRVARQEGGLRLWERSRAARCLSFVEREEISRGVGAASRCAGSRRRLGRAPSTVSREIAANGGRARYRAVGLAAGVARARRPKPAKLARRAAAGVVEDGLEQRWSPQQIALRLRHDFPDDAEMRVSHETIYQSLFVQGRGALRNELAPACAAVARSASRAARAAPPAGSAGW